MHMLTATATSRGDSMSMCMNSKQPSLSHLHLQTTEHVRTVQGQNVCTMTDCHMQRLCNIKWDYK